MSLGGSLLHNLRMWQPRLGRDSTCSFIRLSNEYTLGTAVLSSPSGLSSCETDSPFQKQILTFSSSEEVLIGRCWLFLKSQVKQLWSYIPHCSRLSYRCSCPWTLFPEWTGRPWHTRKPEKSGSKLEPVWFCWNHRWHRLMRKKKKTAAYN